MVKKTPGYVYVGKDTFPTKGEAEKFAVKQRKKKAEEGYKTRYEIDMDPQSGQFRVREFVYMQDTKGNLI